MKTPCECYIADAHNWTRKIYRCIIKVSNRLADFLIQPENCDA